MRALAPRYILQYLAAVVAVALSVSGTQVPAADSSNSGASAALQLFNEGKWAESAQGLSRAVAASPDDVGLRGALAVALLQARNYDEALVQLSEMKRREPQAALFGRLADTVAAERHTSRRGADNQPLNYNVFRPEQASVTAVAPVDAVSPPDTTLQVLTKACRLHPESAALANLLGDAYQLAGEPAQAEVWYKKAIALAPQWVKPVLGLGIASLDTDTPRGANLLEKAAKMDPANSRIKIWLGDAYQRLGRMDEATNLYIEASNDSSTAAAGKVRLGTVKLRQSKAPDAARLYSDAAALDSGGVAAQMGQAQAYAAQQQAAPAQEAFGAAIGNSSGLSNRSKANVYYNGAASLEQTGDLTAAITNYNNAIVLDPKLQPAHARLASALKAEGRLQQKIDEYEARLGQSPGDVEALRFLAEGYEASGDRARQLVVLGKLARLEPENRWSWALRQAEALWETGNRAAAVAKWREAVDLGYPTRTLAVARSVAQRGAEKEVLQQPRAPASAPGRGRTSTKARLLHLQYALAQQKGQLAEALEDLNAVIDADPSNASLYGQRAVLLQQMGNADSAAKDFDRQRELLGAASGSR